MKKGTDLYRAFVDKFEAQVEKETSWLRDIKTTIGVTTFKKRRRAFDHAVVNMLGDYSISPGNVREQLDNQWEETLRSWGWMRYLLLTPGLGLAGPVLLGVGGIRAIWESYISKVKELVNQLWDQAPER